jgi:hypothetical protein
MNYSTSDISSHMHGLISEAPFMKKRSVFGVTLHAANTEHSKNKN